MTVKSKRIFPGEANEYLAVAYGYPVDPGIPNSPKANLGEAESSGVDISLDYSHIINKDWWFTLRGKLYICYK